MSIQNGSLVHPNTRVSIPIYTGFSWPCLLIAPFWFMAKKMWGRGILFLLLDIILMVVTASIGCFVLHLILAFMGNGMHEKRIRGLGYVSQSSFAQGRATQSNSAQNSPAAEEHVDISAQLSVGTSSEIASVSDVTFNPKASKPNGETQWTLKAKQFPTSAWKFFWDDGMLLVWPFSKTVKNWRFRVCVGIFCWVKWMGRQGDGNRGRLWNVETPEPGTAVGPWG